MLKPKEFILTSLNLDNETIEFFSHSKNYLNANLVSKAMGLVTVPIFTRLLLPSSYGVLAIFQSVVGILSVIMSTGLTGGMYRRFFENDKEGYPSFLGSNLAFLSFFSFLVVLLIVLFGAPVAVFFQLPHELLVLASFSAFFTVVFGIYIRLLQANNMSRQYSSIVVLQSLAVLFVSVPWVYFTEKSIRHIGAIYASLFIGFVIFAYSAYKLFKELRFDSGFRQAIGHIKYSLIFGIPLLPHSFGGYMLSYFDRIVVGQIAGVANAGLYSLGYNVGMTLLIAITAMTSAWSPKFFVCMAKNRFDEIERLAVRSAKLILLAALGIIVFSRDFISFFAASQYSASASVVAPVVFGYVFFFLYSLYSMYSQYRKKTFLISINTILSISFSIAMNYLLIPKYGYGVAAYISMGSFFLMFFLHYLTVRFVLKERNAICILKIIPSFLAFAALAILYLYVESMNVGIVFTWASKIISLAVLSAFLFSGIFMRFDAK